MTDRIAKTIADKMEDDRVARFVIRTHVDKLIDRQGYAPISLALVAMHGMIHQQRISPDRNRERQIELLKSVIALERFPEVVDES